LHDKSITDTEKTVVLYIVGTGRIGKWNMGIKLNYVAIIPEMETAR